MTDLNNPEIRQAALQDRLDGGGPLVAADLAAELGISVDTIRRDLIALERRGVLRRVRGGAVPISAPLPSYVTRAKTPDPVLGALASCAVAQLPEAGTVYFDAGTTLTAVAAQLPDRFAGLVVTPAPSVAMAALRRGKRVHLIGGPLCPEGAMAVGGTAEDAVRAIAADLCLLGACGLWPDFGLSAEDAGEAGVKRAMALASARAVVVSAADKLDRRGRFRVLAIDEIDGLITDADPSRTAPFSEAGVELTHV